MVDFEVTKLGNVLVYFTVFEPQSLEMDELYLDQERRSAVDEALTG